MVLSEFMQTVIGTIRGMNIFSIIDIIVVSYIFYKGYSLIKDSRAEQLLKGIILIVVLIPISDALQLTMLNWILNKTMVIGVLSLVIIFQPEIRRALEQLGRTAFTEKHIFVDEETLNKVINEIVVAVDNLSKSKTGALIVIEQNTGLAEIINTGTRLDAIVSSALLENIFVVNTPLHDGATIIRNDKIEAAGCFLPLTNNNDLNKKLGTRHRAGLGITEVSDALVIIVSEETGTISLAVNGKLTRNYEKEVLRDIIVRIIKNKHVRRSTYGGKVKSWFQKVINK